MKRFTLALCGVFVASFLVSQEAPQTGTWAATATGSEAFTEFEFEVNAEGTGIPQVAFGYSQLECGPITESVGMRTASYSPVEPITEDGFTTGGPTPGRVSFVFKGEFDESGIRADGTWQAMFGEEVCGEGTWEAEPKNVDSEG